MTEGTTANDDTQAALEVARRGTREGAVYTRQARDV